MITHLIQSIVFVAITVVLVCFLGACLIEWIARGEADVNGDPERDAGYTGPTVVCSWCGTLLRYGHQPASHGICPACAERVMQCEANAPQSPLKDIVQMPKA